MSESLSDRAVEVIAAIRAVPTYPGFDDNPIRHHVRALKCEAANILSDALTRAYSLTRLAHEIADENERAKAAGQKGGAL